MAFAMVPMVLSLPWDAGWDLASRKHHAIPGPRGSAGHVLPRGQAGEPLAGLSRREWGQIRGAVRASEYRVVPVSRAGEPARYAAQNRAQGYGATFRPEGVELGTKARAGDRWRLGISLRSYGYLGEAHPLAVVEPTAEGDRVSYRRGTVTEWYVNRPSGLEQGFEIAEPERRRNEPIALSIAVVGGLEPRGDEAGGASFLDSAGRTRVRYAGLAAWDADGRTLGARLEVSGRELRVLVEAGEARFPVTVDPTFVQETRLQGRGDPLGTPGAHAGWSVSVSGDTAVLGAPGSLSVDATDDLDTDAAYVFVRSGGVWTEQQKLVAPEPSGAVLFGGSVSISGDTLVVGANGVGPGSAYVYVRSGTVWTQQQKLTASDGAEEDSFGYSVSIEGDTVVVGAPGDDTGGSANTGSAYVFVRSGTVWSEQQKLVASDVSDYLGASTSISGDTLILGTFFEDGPGGQNAGAAYVFVRSGTVWTQQQELFAPDGAAFDWFGYSVAVSGDTAVVGANNDATPGGGASAGSAYVFLRSGSVWSLQQKLEASDGAADDIFGQAVSISGDTLVVGAYYDDTTGGHNAGSAYVFVRSGTVWTEQQKLLASDAAAYDAFGGSVAVSGDLALVGALYDGTVGGAEAGSAHVYVRSGANWSEQQELITSGLEAANDSFGWSAAISGDTALVGAPQDDMAGAADRGSAYVFVRSGTQWTEQQRLVASDAGAGDLFGSAVALSADTAVVGAPGCDTAGGSDAGSAYVFVRSGTVWSQQGKLQASDAAAGDGFGGSVAVSGDTALVGAAPAAAQAGAAYAFVRSGAAWSQQQKLLAADAATGDLFGVSVAVSGDTALVGASLDDAAAGADAGAAYAFLRTGTVWSEEQKLTASDAMAMATPICAATSPKRPATSCITRAAGTRGDSRPIAVAATISATKALSLRRTIDTMTRALATAKIAMGCTRSRVPQRWMRAEPPLAKARTWSRLAMLVSPGNVVSSAPWAQPSSTARWGSSPLINP